MNRTNAFRLSILALATALSSALAADLPDPVPVRLIGINDLHGNLESSPWLTLTLADPGAKSFLAWLTDLKRKIGVPARLRDAGIKEDQLPQLVEVATADACHPNNPKPVTKADFEAIFKAAY